MATIMVVDDDETIRGLVTEVLKSDGHQILEEQNGLGLLDRLGVSPGTTESVFPDLIIMDVMMPVMDGFTTHNHLQNNTRSRRIPVMILTSKGAMKEPFSGSSNVAAFMEKPFEAAALRAEVKRLLALKGKK